MVRPPRFPNKLVIIGVAFVLVGGILLLRTAGYLSRAAALWPVAPLVAGLVLLYFRVFRKGPDYYVFLGTALLLAGLLLLLTNTAVPVELSRVWPLFLSIIGVALLAYGLRRRGGWRVTFTIPGACMVLLSAVFLPFSLEFVTVGFAEFVAVWWPVLLMGVGLALVVAHLRRRRSD